MKVTKMRFEESRTLEVEKIARREGKSISEVLQEILEKGLREYKIEKAIENYLNGSLSQGAAAEEAGLTTQEFHQELKRRGFALRIDVKLIEAEIEMLKRMVTPRTLL